MSGAEVAEVEVKAKKSKGKTEKPGFAKLKGKTIEKLDVIAEKDAEIVKEVISWRKKALNASLKPFPRRFSKKETEGEDKPISSDEIALITRLKQAADKAVKSKRGKLSYHELEQVFILREMNGMNAFRCVQDGLSLLAPQKAKKWLAERAEKTEALRAKRAKAERAEARAAKTAKPKAKKSKGKKAKQAVEQVPTAEIVATPEVATAEVTATPKPKRIRPSRAKKTTVETVVSEKVVEIQPIETVIEPAASAVIEQPTEAPTETVETETTETPVAVE